MDYQDVFKESFLNSMSKEAFGIYDSVGKLMKVVATQKEADSYVASHNVDFVIKQNKMKTFWQEILPELNSSYKDLIDMLFKLN